MTRSIRAVVAILAFAGLTMASVVAQPAPETAQVPEAPAKPGATAECGKKIEALINSVMSQFDGTAPKSASQRRALETFRSAAAKALDSVHAACADEKSAAAVKDLEAAHERLQTALELIGPALEQLHAALSEKQKLDLDALRQQFEGLSKDWNGLAATFDRYLRDHTDPRTGEVRMCLSDFCVSFPRELSNDRRTPERSPERSWHPPLHEGEEEL